MGKEREKTLYSVILLFLYDDIIGFFQAWTIPNAALGGGQMGGREGRGLSRLWLKS